MIVETQTTIQAGIHPHLSREQYDAIPAMNATTILWGLYSQQHMKAAIDGLLSRESNALSFGRPLHHYILERDSFEFHWAISEACGVPLKSGPNKGEPCGKAGIAKHGTNWVCGLHRMEQPLEENVVTDGDMKRIERIADALKGHKIVKLLRERGGCEATAVSELRGVPFKCRLDKLILSDNAETESIIDLKSVRMGHGERDRFSKSINEYDYAIRAAIYVDAVKKITGKELPFIWVAVESEIPYAVGVYQCTEESIRFGRFMYQMLIDAYKHSSETNRWGGYTDKIEPNGVPEWVIKKWGTALDE